MNSTLNQFETTIEQDAEEFRLNSLEIARQSLAEKDARMQTLLTRIEVLEGFISRVSAQPQLQPQAQPARARKSAPRRWSVR